MVRGTPWPGEDKREMRSDVCDRRQPGYRLVGMLTVAAILLLVGCEEHIAPDLVPSFGGQQVADRAYTVGVEITVLTLPEASGGDGALTYALSPTVPGLTFDSSTRRLSGTPTAAGLGTHTLTYGVTDTDGDDASLTFKVSIEEVPGSAPSFGGQQVADQTYTVGVEITALTLPEASGGDGALTYALSPTVPGLTFDPTSRTVSGTPTKADTYRMTYSVADADGNTAGGDTDTQTFTITIQEPNKPSFGKQRVETQRYVAGVAIPHLVLPRATRGDGTLTYRLTPVPRGMSFDARARTLSGVPASPGSHLLQYRVEDADGDAAELSFRIEARSLTTIYWAAGTAIQRVSMSGGRVENVVASDPPLWLVALDHRPADPVVYWVEGHPFGEVTAADAQAERKIRRMTTAAGGDAEDIVTTQNAVFGIALDLTHEKLYWSDGGKLRRADLDGSNVQDIAEAQLIFGPAVDATNAKLYWYETSLTLTDPPTGKLRRANLDGSGSEDIVVLPQSHVSSIAVDATREKLYWSEMIFEMEGGQGEDDPGRAIFVAIKIWRANLDGGDKEEIATGRPFWIGGLILHNEKLYWSGVPVFGGSPVVTLWRANLDGSETEEIGTHVIQSVAIDPTDEKLYLVQLDSLGGSTRIVRADLDGNPEKDVVVSRRRSYEGGMALDVNGGEMYWVANRDPAKICEESVIMRSSMDGSDEEEVLAVAGEVGQIEFDVVDRKLYWAETVWGTIEEHSCTDSITKIRRADLTGGDVEDLVRDEYLQKFEMDAMDRKLYWIGGTAIWRANLDGTAAVSIVVDRFGNSFAIDVVGRKLYWDDRDENVYRAELDGSDKEIIMNNVDDIHLQAVDGANGKLYYSYREEREEGEYYRFSSVIARANLDGSGAQDITREGDYYYRSQLALGVR